MYILDTCAIRGISRQKLQKAKNIGIEIAISTITAFELASHLLRGETSKSYERVRGNFLKCEIPEILDDSAVRWADRIGSADIVNSTRREERDLLIQTLSIVSEFESLETLNTKNLCYPDGQTVTLTDFGQRISYILKKEENDHVSRMRKLLDQSEFFLDLDGRYTMTSEILLSNLRQAAEGTQKHAPAVAVDSKAILLSQALYIGYLLNRLYVYKNSPGKDIDPNDYEDAFICLTIDLNAGDVLVTDDKGTVSALRSIMRYLRDCYPQLESECVMTTDEFTQIC